MGMGDIANMGDVAVEYGILYLDYSDPRSLRRLKIARHFVLPLVGNIPCRLKFKSGKVI